mmetsp:Transcript_23363/g.41878  ORF Transcript_23363/g.41878 Transcript_23363/m.41878 type:complete len:221 (+) Transcript_23363:1148-1810(+)
MIRRCKQHWRQRRWKRRRKRQRSRRRPKRTELRFRPSTATVRRQPLRLLERRRSVSARRRRMQVALSKNPHALSSSNLPPLLRNSGRPCPWWRNGRRLSPRGPNRRPRWMLPLRKPWPMPPFCRTSLLTKNPVRPPSSSRLETIHLFSSGGEDPPSKTSKISPAPASIWTALRTSSPFRVPRIVFSTDSSRHGQSLPSTKSVRRTRRRNVLPGDPTLSRL